MEARAVFESAFPYGEDIMSLPVADVDAAVDWYGQHFGMAEVERKAGPQPTVIMERDRVRIGFSVNGGNSSQEGAGIRVSDIHAARSELESKGLNIGNWRVDEQDGRRFQVFFVVAPDGLCYYFHQPLSAA